MKTLKLTLFGLFLSLFTAQAHSLTSVCNFGGGTNPYYQHYATYSPSDYSYLGGMGSHQASYNVLSPIASSGSQAELMGAGGGNKNRVFPIAETFGFWSFIGKSTLGYGVGSAFEPFGSSIECSRTLDYKEVTTTLTLSSYNVVEGTTITASWNGVNADYCFVLGQSRLSTGSLNITVVPGDSGMHQIFCFNAHDFDDDFQTLNVNACPSPVIHTTGINYTLLNGTSPSSGLVGEFSSTGLASVSTDAYCDGDKWRLALTNVQQSGTIDVNLSNLNMIAVNTGSSGAGGLAGASCSTLSTIRASLVQNASQISVSPSTSPWYADEAVYNHEYQHAIQYSSQADGAFAVLKSDFANDAQLSIPLSFAATAAEAKSAIMATSAYLFRISDFRNSLNSNTMIFSHAPSSLFISAQNSGISTYLAYIDDRMGPSGLNCP